MLDVKTIQASAAPTRVAGTTLRSFDAAFKGELLQAGDAGYDEARSIWNGMIDKRPALIARCADTGDVVEAVNFAREHHLLVAVRGGGHNVAGHAVVDGGMMIDLSTMKRVEVDPDARVARVQPGATWGDVDGATQEFGLAVPGGLVSSTGVAGLTLGGGFGWLSRAFGMTCDSLVSADVVTAAGTVVTAGEEENQELFWGLRGGGGNFGIVTSFEFRLHPVGPEVLCGLVIHSLDNARAVIRNYREVVAEARDELSCYLLFRHAPPKPFIPESVQGTPILALVMCYAGDVEEGVEAAHPLREFGNPIADVVMSRPYVAFQQLSDANWDAGYRDYWKSDYLTGLSDAAIDTLVKYARTLPTQHTDFKIAHFEGAISRVPADATAFPHREAPFVININTRWENPAADDEHIAWTRDLFQAVQPFSTGGTYVNFLDKDDGGARVKSAYGNNYDRLVALKNRYDPDNFFRMNQNIKPAG